MQPSHTIAPIAQPHPISYYPSRIRDASAIYLGEGEFGTAGDGCGDDAPVLQRAINRVQESGGTGVVFVPEGRYRLGSTVHVWRGIRLIGFGRRRPVLILGTCTPGFGDPTASTYMVHFCRGRPKPGDPILDAWEGTFYAGISNIDFDIGDGNPAAVAVRFHVAQLCSLEHIEFRLGTARAGIEAIGNEVDDCRFVGGRFGIITGPTAAGWQALITDCHFEGQAEACIQTERAGLTIIRSSFTDAPHAIRIPEHGVEQLFLQDSRLERIAGPALLLCSESVAGNQIQLERVVAEEVPILYQFRRSGNKLSPSGARYIVQRLSHGLHLDPAGKPGRWLRRIDTRVEWQQIDRLPPLPQPAHRTVPSCSAWTDVRDFGAIGDGRADDTEAIRRAVAACEAVYLPMGRYRITDTIHLRGDTALIGLHGERTQIVMTGGEAGFGDPAQPRPMIASPSGGTSIVSGLGLDPGENPGAVALLWRAGERSLVDDIWFEWGGHGDAAKGEGFLCSLTVADGGGGVFKNIWSPNIRARNGLVIRDTATPGRLYLVSVEHHRDAEIRLEHVRNWSFYALQTEENIGSEHTIALDIVDCGALDFINLFMYRVRSLVTAHSHGIAVARSGDVHFRGIHSFSFGLRPYDNSLLHVEAEEYVPECDLVHLPI